MASNVAEKTSPSLDSRESYRDELNFAEFPLALLDRPREGQKTIEFSDTIFDRGRNAPVTRKLTISASDKYGLPTPRDEEVILGLIQLSHQSHFADRKVFFTKGELVRLLGWSDDGKSYQRISEALNKWAGITLFWEKSWWSNDDKCWVDETFHILDNVTLLDRERYNRKLTQRTPDSPSAMSSFVWNEVVFTSFHSGYIKQLDFDFYRSLSSAIAKKMFRFLDKRFHKARRLEFDLRVFALEHIGLSRSYHNGEIKRKLRPAIAELEEKGFLEWASEDERFVKRQRGEWSIGFTRKWQGKGEDAEEPREISRELMRRGVGAKVAGMLAEKHSEKNIWEKIHLHDRLMKSTDKKPRNPPAFLVAAIRDGFAVAPAAPLAPSAAPDVPKPTSTPKSTMVEDEKDRAKRQEFEAWWAQLPAPEREGQEREAVASADKFSYLRYEEGKEKGGLLFQTVREKILLAHFERQKVQKRLSNVS